MRIKAEDESKVTVPAGTEASFEGEREFFLNIEEIEFPEDVEILSNECDGQRFGSLEYLDEYLHFCLLCDLMALHGPRPSQKEDADRLRAALANFQEKVLKSWEEQKREG